MTQQLVKPQANASKEAPDLESMARHYDEAVFKAVPGYDAMHTMALTCLQAYLPQEASVLTVGPGTGKEIIRLGQANPQWSFLGVDPSEDMLSMARQKLSAESLSDRVILQQGFAHELPTDVLYDAATSMMVLHFLPFEEKLTFLKSISDRLRTDAPFVITTLRVGKETSELDTLIPIVKAYWKVSGLPEERVQEVWTGFQSDMVIPTPEAKILELLDASGFKNIVRFYTGLWVGGWLAFKA